MAVATGMRLEELLGLKWDQVDLDRKEVCLVVTKSKQPRVVPLSARAVAILVAAARGGHASPYVFTNPASGSRYKTIKRAFKTACRRAGVQGHTFP